jgi:hypothetical protein
LPPNVAAPPYDRSRLKRGIAHFGVGNFHRAHQAFYIDPSTSTAVSPGLARRTGASSASAWAAASGAGRRPRSTARRITCIRSPSRRRRANPACA